MSDTIRFRHGHVPSFSEVWPGVGTGRYWKRRLSKARRRAWKQGRVVGNPYRGQLGVEGEVNWRTW